MKAMTDAAGDRPVILVNPRLKVVQMFLCLPHISTTKGCKILLSSKMKSDVGDSLSSSVYPVEPLDLLWCPKHIARKMLKNKVYLLYRILKKINLN